MATTSIIPNVLAPGARPERAGRTLAAAVTRAASKQTYYTVRFLVDRPLVDDAYRAYGYFRWVDDQLDQGGMDRAARMAFVERQRAIIDGCYRGAPPRDLADEETMLAELIGNHPQAGSGLHSYIDNMMAVMAFDAERRGRLISEAELSRYTGWLATAVTDALHFFIGHDCPPPPSTARYLAATGAHVAHMLRDTLEDVEEGYYNVPYEYLQARRIGPRDVASEAYREWVRCRVEVARACFRAGRSYLAQVESARCRIAGYAYIERFTGVLKALERSGYRLAASCPERKKTGAGLKVTWHALAETAHTRVAEQPAHIYLSR